MAENYIKELVVALALLFACVKTEDYCAITCQGKKHTMCLYKSVSKVCDNYDISDASAVKKQMLELHNSYRDQFANQEAPRQKEIGFPKAANMKRLYWDSELEMIAKRWAEQCDFNHDGCRDVKRFRVGQNLGERSISVGHIPESSQESFTAWVDEIKDADPSVQKSFASSPDKVIGHFTQVAWANSDSLGCAEISYDTYDHNLGKMRARYIVCNYGPGGNVMTLPMYAEGSPCSQCPSGMKCGGKYKNLCMDPDRSDDEAGESSSVSLKGSKVLLVSLVTILQFYSKQLS